MKGQIILPSFYVTRYTDNYKFLLRAIADKYGFSYEYTDDPIIHPDTELIITFAIPQHNRITNYPWARFINRPKHVKLIAWLRDIQCYDEDCCKAMFIMMDSADIVLTNSYKYSRSVYPEFVDKIYFMGDFFADHNRYDLGINPAPDYRCLLSGASSEDIYPLRHKILSENRSPLIGWLPPPSGGQVKFQGDAYNGQHSFIGDKYAKLLYRFFCCVTDCSVFEYALSKHMEIPASGSLLVTNSCEDLTRLGFRPSEHYIEVNQNNVFDIINDILTNLDSYQGIREEGHKFVHEKHGLDNRITELSSLIEKVIK